MPIPSGYHIGARGYLVSDRKNGNGNGNGSNNGNGNGHANGNGNGTGNGNGNGGGVSEGLMNIPLKLEIPATIGEFKTGLMFRETLDENTGMLFIFDSVANHSFHMKNTTIPLDIAFINREGIIESIKSLNPLSREHVFADASVLYALEVNRGWFKENNVNVGDQILNPLSEDVQIHDSKGNLYAEIIDIIKPEPIKVPQSNIKWIELDEATRLPTKTGNIIFVYLSWRAKNFVLQMFFPQSKKPSRREVQDQLEKVYPGAKLWNYQISSYEPGEPLLQAGESK
tara:strand:+ start:245 stop:1096 length:852 start_codon:yes stop_codon:yes gene_type:complete